MAALPQVTFRAWHLAVNQHPPPHLMSLGVLGFGVVLVALLGTLSRASGVWSNEMAACSLRARTLFAASQATSAWWSQMTMCRSAM